MHLVFSRLDACQIPGSGAGACDAYVIAADGIGSLKLKARDAVPYNRDSRAALEIYRNVAAIGIQAGCVCKNIYRGSCLH
jgi:hypothetical protein